MKQSLILPGATLRDRIIASLGAMAGIGLTGFLSAVVLGQTWGQSGNLTLPLLAAPMGAVAILLFATPASPLAQPWPIIGGNVISALAGIITARVAKRSGDLLSLEYKNLEMLDARSGRQAAYWSHNAARGKPITRITINPKTNGGERGEVSIKGISGGSPLGSGPGGGVIADIEIRYALGRGDSGAAAFQACVSLA